VTDHAPARERVWLGRLGRLLDLGASPEVRQDDDARHRQFEELILGGPRRYTRAQLLAESGMDPDLMIQLWRSLGFAEVPDDEVVFTEGDRDALSQLELLRQAGLLPVAVEDAVARSVGQAMAGLADWQIEMLYQLFDYGHRTVDEREMMEITERVIPLLEQMQGYVWRRHLAAAAGRVLAATPGESETQTLTVGFADLVGFTRATRRLSPTDLTKLIGDFQGVATDVVATCRGRVVKTVGDEVLFVADAAPDCVEIALQLVERLAATPSLPELRIGLAVGEVVTRFGDVYGEAVNIAARLTAHARPGRILVDRNLAAALEHDSRFQLHSRRPLAVRGYRHLQQWELTRADSESSS
jgi:adenylate cyclase